MNENFNQTMQITPSRIHIHGVENYDGSLSFNFVGLLQELSDLDVFYRAGLGTIFAPFEGESSLLDDSGFEDLRRAILDRNLFPFISCARDSNSEIVMHEDGTVYEYAVVYKFRGRWECSYVTEERAVMLLNDTENAYCAAEEQFIHNLYTMLVYHHAITEFNDTFEPIEKMVEFLNNILTGKYSYIHFHTLGNSTPNEDGTDETVVCVVGLGKEERGVCYDRKVDAFYVNTEVAGYMYDAVMGNREDLQNYIDIETSELVSYGQQVDSQSTTMIDFLESSHTAEEIDSLVRGVMGGNVDEGTIRGTDTENEVEVGMQQEEQPVGEIDARLLLSENSNTYLIDESTSRFSDAVWYQKIQNASIMIAGLGGIGSWVAFLLARMKPKSLMVIDPDTVEMVNMAGQLFGENDIGLSKVTAMCNIMSSYCNYHRYMAYTNHYNITLHGASDIMICGFDNMKARKEYFRAWCDYVAECNEEDRKECLFIDGRLNAEEFQILCIRGDHAYHRKKYEHEWLFSDLTVEEATCSYKQTSFCANMIASCMVNLFVNHIANKCDVLIERPLPFLTYYNAETMQFKME